MARVGAREIAAKLREDIRSGRYQPGQRLPSERDLTQLYDVATMTARRAVEMLRGEGLVEVRHGSGSYVREPAERRAVRVPRGATVIGRAATPEEVAQFDIEPGAAVFEVWRTHHGRRLPRPDVYACDHVELFTS